jgi:hypothetical protein
VGKSPFFIGKTMENCHFIVDLPIKTGDVP